jgi:hypothetical protein
MGDIMNNKETIVATGDRDEALKAAMDLLRSSGFLKEGLRIIKRDMSTGVPYEVLKLMDDENRVNQLVEDVAEVYVDAGFTANEMRAILEFYVSGAGQKLIMKNAEILPKTGEITINWVYDIIEEVQMNEEKEKSNDIEIPETGPLPD